MTFFVQHILVALCSVPLISNGSSSNLSAYRYADLNLRNGTWDIPGSFLGFVESVVRFWNETTDISESFNSSLEERVAGQRASIPFHRLGLDELKTISLTPEACTTLDGGGCVLSRYSDCDQGRLATICNPSTSSNLIASHLTKVHGIAPFHPLKIRLDGIRSFTQEMISPMGDNIFLFEVAYYSRFNVMELQSLRMVNMLELKFYRCYDIVITKQAMLGYGQLRLLNLVLSTIKSLEQGSLESLMELKLLVLDSEFNPRRDAGFSAYLRRMHCSPEYAWLRNYLWTKPGLLGPRESGEVYTIGNWRNRQYNFRDAYYPVDCAREDLTQEGDFQTLVQFAVGVNLRRLTLANLITTSVPAEICATLDGDGCELIKYSDCDQGRLATICSPSSTSSMIESHLTKIYDVAAHHPLKIRLDGTRNFSQDMIHPMADNIFLFEVGYYPDLDLMELISLNLNNLLELRFWKCSSIRITKLSVARYKDLRIFTLMHSTIAFLEQGSFESMVSLKCLVLDWGASNGSPRDHLFRLHCSAQYYWFREYLRMKSELIKARDVGKVYNIGRWQSDEWKLREIYYPVDCSRDDLTQQGALETLLPFTIHDEKLTDINQTVQNKSRLTKGKILIYALHCL